MAKSPEIIAEFGISHCGDFRALVEAMTEYLSADIFKFQLHSLDEMHKSHRHRSVIEDTMLPEGDILMACKIAQDMGKMSMVTAFCPRTAEIVADWYDQGYVDYIKVGSGEADNAFMAEIYGHRRTVVSLGICGKTYFKNATYLHCVSEYPTVRHGLERMSQISEDYGYPSGYSDHSPSGAGWLTAIMATTLGACLLERHVKVKPESPDAAVEDDHYQFARYVMSAKEAGSNLVWRCQKSDVENWARHYWIAIQDISPGEALSYSNISTARFDEPARVGAVPASIPPFGLATRRILRGDIVFLEDVTKE